MHSCILFLNEVSWIGGAERALLDLMSGLDRDKFRPILVCPCEGAFPDAARATGIEVHVVPFYGVRARNPLRYFETMARLRAIVRKHKIELIHVNHQYFSNYGVVLGRICRLPVIVHLRGVETDEFFKSFAPWLARADRVICVSHAVRTRLLEYANLQLGSRQRNRLVHGSCVAYDGLRPPKEETDHTAFRQRFGIKQNARIVGIVGQVVREKGLCEFVAAAEIVKHDCRDAHFLVVGEDTGPDGEFAAEIKERTQKIGMQGSFTFTGFRSDAAALFQLLDVSVLASWQEAFGRVVLETFCSGVPMVATSVGGVPEMIEDGINGILVPPKDPSALADAILRVLKMPEDERQRMVQEGKKTAARFSVESHVEQIQAIYDELLSRNQLRVGRND